MTEIEYATKKLAENKARIRHLEKVIDWFLYHDACPRTYNNSVWCRRICPVFGRYGGESKHVCTNEEIMELVEKEIANN